MRPHDHLALGQELVGDLDRLVQRAARIAADIEQQPPHALRAEIGQRALDVVIRVLAEILHPDVARLRVDHEIRRDRRDVHLVAQQLDGERLLVAAAFDLDVDARAARAAQLVHRLVGVPPLRALSVDRRDDVAGADALLVRGRPLEHDERGDVFADLQDRHADAVIAPFLALAHLRVFLRREIARMRVQRAEHAANRAGDEILGIDLVVIVRLDGAQRVGEGAVVLENLVVGGECVAAEQAADERRNDDGEQHDGQDTVASHREVA